MHVANHPNLPVGRQVSEHRRALGCESDLLCATNTDKGQNGFRRKLALVVLEQTGYWHFATEPNLAT
jgi:hypothetical protein